MKKILGLFFLITVSIKASGSEEIVVPDNELTTEVSLPKLDYPLAVKKSNITFKDRYEMGLFWGSNFTEPIYAPSKIGIDLSYHNSEKSSWVFSYSQWQGGLNSQYVPGIEDQGQIGGTSGDYDFNRAPRLTNAMWGYYNLKLYYGKISIAKKNTMNLSLYTQYGAGLVGFTHKSYPAVSVGVGQKFYFNNSFGVKAEVRLQYAGEANPFLGNDKLKKNQPVPSFSEFEDKYRFGTIFELGALWML